MGFRNMSQFNLALLAKQGWRILNNADSLVTKSYTWKSIWAAKDVLRKGLIWRVGTGTNISINNDAWVPEALHFRLSSTVDSLRDCYVHMLIDNNKRKWKEELIRYTFSEEDAEIILRIPLAGVPHDDFLAWG
ncbi:Cyclopropane-fatty-acyl-phospholipid synthase [Gossypium australe]|uniref:Cyclopropane-fatty-acyl-phospholipid synthase n=1 Tax=Gossypium australe TaxID=47621 RepID=A0A5B6WTC8_9ROSI|nr:Cyclopropane-fatty-acyl-phospholipid synthase [Gossypium australe]